MMEKSSKVFGYLFMAMTIVTGCAAIGGASHHYATAILSGVMTTVLFNDARPKKNRKSS